MKSSAKVVQHVRYEVICRDANCARFGIRGGKNVDQFGQDRSEMWEEGFVDTKVNHEEGAEIPFYDCEKENVHLCVQWGET
jgi:hypothetical protein